jgi:di/tricarboxylate transporter
LHIEVSMNSQLVITFAILVAAVFLFLSDRLRPDLIALLVAISLGVSGVLTSQEVFSGFSRSAVITILAVYVFAEALQKTGVTDRVGQLLLRLGGSTEPRLAVTVMLAGAVLSLFMNNIAAASVLLPAVSGAARKAKANPSRLLMPLAFGTIVGGMATLLTSANIVVSNLLRDRGLAGFSLLDFAPLGLPVVAVGVAYMALLGRRWLPCQPSKQALASGIETVPNGPSSAEADLFDIYRLSERLLWARVPPSSELIGQSLKQSHLRQSHNLNAIAIERKGQKMFSLSPEVTFREGDVVLFAARPEEVSAQELQPLLEVVPSANGWPKQGLESSDIVMVEAVLSPRSALIDKTLCEVLFREKYNMSVIAIWRAGRPIRTGLANLPLRFGDALLLQGPRQRLQVLRSDPDLIVLNGLHESTGPMRNKAWIALTVMAVTLLLAAIGPLPIGEVMFGGALAIVLLNVVSMDRAYQAIDWKTIFLVAGMLPLGIAMTKTGAASYLAEGMMSFLGPAGPMALLGGLFVLTMLLTQVVNSAAVAAVVVPIGIQSAQQMGADPRAMAMAIALATSMTFVIPVSHPVNLLVMGPGGYRFRDYVKVGLPLTLLLFATVMLLLPVFWPLFPG